MAEPEKLTPESERVIRDYLWNLAGKVLLFAGLVNVAAIVTAWVQIQAAAERVATSAAELRATAEADKVATKIADAATRELEQVRVIAQEALRTAMQETRKAGTLAERNDVLAKQLLDLNDRLVSLQGGIV